MDWPRHRERCRAAAPYVSHMIAAAPPVELEYISVSAILFLADEDQPRIITVKCRPPCHPTRNRCPIPSGAAAKPWYGNVVVFKFNGPRRQGYTEAGSSDLPALSAYFLSH
ncbi:hypothetical protein B0H13DRAFT_1960683 [Mycena leptocephala]|nr:hypothetical protein B0H13DRAFT_1960683 [Mycena leptocephala]